MSIQSVQAEEELIVVYDDKPPTLEFLDYLGSMVETEGELVGPEHFDESDAKNDDAEERDVWVSKENPYE